jgi:hypothetical protein
MTLITMQGDKVVMRAGAVATETTCCRICCGPCVCGGAEVPIGGNAREIIFTVGANEGGMTIGDVCTYCMYPHFIFLTTAPVQTSLKCTSLGCNFMDIELAQNVSGPYAGFASGTCLSSGLYRIRLFISVGNLIDCDCNNGDFCDYELTGWEFLTSDFADATFIGNITLGELCD